ncbi:MAG TPA: hypothetical protein VHP58_01585 [Alphaproteobacteria bacterium]|nr:hypothetical protein [Alphaproteobacteria bacterium]
MSSQSSGRVSISKSAARPDDNRYDNPEQNGQNQPTRKQEWTGASDESNGAEWNQKAESTLNDNALNAARAAYSGSDTYASYDEQNDLDDDTQTDNARGQHYGDAERDDTGQFTSASDVEAVNTVPNDKTRDEKSSPRY